LKSLASRFQILVLQRRSTRYGRFLQGSSHGAYGVIVWLIVEAAFSAYLRIWFNVGVDCAVLALFSVPLLKGIAHTTNLTMTDEE